MTDVDTNSNDLIPSEMLQRWRDERSRLSEKIVGLQHRLDRYFPDSIRIVANRRRTRPPMEGISLCGHSAAPI
jgi:hypothetical protein